MDYSDYVWVPVSNLATYFAIINRENEAKNYGKFKIKCEIFFTDVLE